MTCVSWWHIQGHVSHVHVSPDRPTILVLYPLELQTKVRKNLTILVESALLDSPPSP